MQDAVVYLTILIFFAGQLRSCSVTMLGLRTRAVGENPGGRRRRRHQRHLAIG